jgi:hypothetical protein
VARVPPVLHLLQDPHRRQHRRAGGQRRPVLPHRLQEVDDDSGGVRLLGLDLGRPLGRAQRTGQDVVEVGVAIGDDQLVVEAVGGMVGAVDEQRLVGLGLDQHGALHRDAGGRVQLAQVALHAPDRSPVEEVHAQVDEVAEVVPEDVVGPAPLVAGGADVDEALDEEAAGDVPDLLLARPGPREEALALAAKAHRMAQPVDLAAPLAGRDHAPGTG